MHFTQVKAENGERVAPLVCSFTGSVHLLPLANIYRWEPRKLARTSASTPIPSLSGRKQLLLGEVIQLPRWGYPTYMEYYFRHRIISILSRSTDYSWCPEQEDVRLPRWFKCQLSRTSSWLVIMWTKAPQDIFKVRWPWVSHKLWPMWGRENPQEGSATAR